MREFSSVDSVVSSKPLNILIAEDEPDIAALYKTVLEKRKHKATITTNGEDCLKAYHEIYQRHRFSLEQELYHQSGSNNTSFDVVILDCKMPQINGIEVAKEILAVNPHQRIIFASAYIKDTVVDSIKNLRQVTTESVQKPFEIKRLIDLIEDKMVYEELKKLDVDIDVIKAVNPTHEQVSDLLGRLQNVQNYRLNEKK
ncbi:MAG TPA: response regulator [Nitrososphaeraceae archaeon]|nr:response regulator [Nitrososphaeraceae archaeon]